MSEKWPEGWDEHRLDQIRWIAQNTTPTQRIQWLEQTMELFRDQILAQRERERAETAWTIGPQKS
jgi:hypothetical protein